MEIEKAINKEMKWIQRQPWEGRGVVGQVGRGNCKFRSQALRKLLALISEMLVTQLYLVLTPLWPLSNPVVSTLKLFPTPQSSHRSDIAVTSS